MAWINLRGDILDDFEELAITWRAQELFTAIRSGVRRLERQHDYYQRVRSAPAWRAKENAATRARRLEQRVLRARTRPPCPSCGRPVERCGPTAKIPIYCQHKCARAAVFARWYAKHGADRNQKRRKTDRKSPQKKP